MSSSGFRKAVTPEQQPFDRDVQGRGEQKRRQSGNMLSPTALNRGSVPAGEASQQVEVMGGEASRCADVSQSIGDPSRLVGQPDTCASVHGYECTRENESSQGILSQTAGGAVADDSLVATDPVTRRIKRLMDDQKMSGRALADAAGLSESAINLALARDSSFKTNTLQRIADALKVPVQSLFDGGVNTEMRYLELEQWVHKTPAIMDLLVREADVRVGDLLRYKATPSSKGQHSAEEVWAHMQALRSGPPVDGEEVTEEQERSVLKRSRRR